MKRREFIWALSAGATTPLLRLPLARAQQAMPEIGFLSSSSLASLGKQLLAAFHQGLKEGGFVERQNVAIDYRESDGQRERLPGLAADLVRRRAAVIVGVGSGDPARAAKAATSTIPIVFAMGGDPVGTGVVASLGKPGGNITGTTWLASELLPKRLELLRDLLPNLSVAGFLDHPANFSSKTDAHNMQEAARALGVQIVIQSAATDTELAGAFAAMSEKRVQALVIQAESFFSIRRDRIVALAAHFSLPVAYSDRSFPQRGGLMSYDADREDSFRQAGLYTARILKGEKPGDLPVLQPTKFEFVINRKTAAALGLTFPPSFELRATEVIE